MQNSFSRTSNLVAAWQKEEATPFAGWDFSHLDGRMLEDQPPWDYVGRASELMRRSSSALDMGTGGGERLLQMRRYWPRTLIATEDYPPNVWLAFERLAPHGAVVVAKLDQNEGMPFGQNSFDLVLNRHSGLNPQEVARILAPNGVFLTQQIHALWAADLIAAFGGELQWPNCTLDAYRDQLQQAGFTISYADEWQGQLLFTDVGAIVYYLRAVPWLVPGFSVSKHFENLLQLQDQLDQGQPLVFQIRKFILETVQI